MTYTAIVDQVGKHARASLLTFFQNEKWLAMIGAPTSTSFFSWSVRLDWWLTNNLDSSTICCIREIKNEELDTRTKLPKVNLRSGSNQRLRRSQAVRLPAVPPLPAPLLWTTRSWNMWHLPYIASRCFWSSICCFWDQKAWSHSPQRFLFHTEGGWCAKAEPIKRRYSRWRFQTQRCELCGFCQRTAASLSLTSTWLCEVWESSDSQVGIKTNCLQSFSTLHRLL